MSDIIPNYEINELLRLSIEKWVELKSGELYHKGQSIGFLVIPNTDYIKAQAERFAQLSNTVGGSQLAELIPEENMANLQPLDNSLTCLLCLRTFKGRLGLISHQRTHKKEEVSV